MKIVALTDLHGKTAILKLISHQLQEADLVLLCGDITHFGHRTDIAAIIGELSSLNRNILAVSGNCDNPDVQDYLEGEGLSLHGKTIDFGGCRLAGLGGSLPCPFPTRQEFKDELFASLLGDIASDPGFSGQNLILVSHQPPYGTKADRMIMGFHVGSRSIREFIETHQPLACFTGHIHEGRSVDYIGRTAIVNPGAAFKNNYALAVTGNDTLTRLDILTVV